MGGWSRIVLGLGFAENLTGSSREVNETDLHLGPVDKGQEPDGLGSFVADAEMIMNGRPTDA
jgi:hypothetical protein